MSDQKKIPVLINHYVVFDDLPIHLNATKYENTMLRNLKSSQDGLHFFHCIS